MGQFARLELFGPPDERGRLHGERFAAAIESNIETYKERFAHDGVEPSTIEESAMAYLERIDRDVPEYGEELRGIAAGSELPLVDVTMLNARWEIIYAARSRAVLAAVDGCTSVGVTPPATADGRTYIGQNWDWLVPIRENLVLVERHRDDAPDSIGMTEAGIVGEKIGVNQAGIGLCVNGIIGSIGDTETTPLPYHVRFYQVLRASRFDAALTAILSGKRGSPANVLIGHAAGEVIDLEADPTRVGWLYPEDGILTHSNHFETDVVDSEIDPAGPSTLYRARRLRRLLAAHHGDITPTDLQDGFRDHFSEPASICSHADESRPLLERGQTNASLILDLEERELVATLGNPCRESYQTYAMSPAGS